MTTTGLWRGKALEDMTKQELIEVIRWTSQQYLAERRYNQRLEKALPDDWQSVYLKAAQLKGTEK